MVRYKVISNANERIAFAIPVSTGALRTLNQFIIGRFDKRPKQMFQIKINQQIFIE